MSAPEEHCGDDNCLCHGDRRHKTGFCESPEPPAEIGVEWTCPECGRTKVSFRLDDGGLPDFAEETLKNRGYDLSQMYGWRG